MTGAGLHAGVAMVAGMVPFFADNLQAGEVSPAALCEDYAGLPEDDGPHAGMVWIEGGSFTMGDDGERPEEAAAHEVSVGGFWIDRHEVTNAQFTRFVEATGYVTVAERGLDAADHPGVPPELLAPGAVVFTPPDGLLNLVDVRQWWRFVPGADWRHPRGPGSSIEGHDNHPVVNVAYEDAQAYARWRGRALPTEAQWEFAARGGLDGATYSWGDEYYDPVAGWRANTWQGVFPLEDGADDGYHGTAPVGCFEANGYGLFDMAGNVWEYARDWYVPGHPPEPATDPVGPDMAVAARYAGAATPSVVIKGGSYLCAPNFCARYRPAARQPQELSLGASHLGFRTVLNAPDDKAARHARERGSAPERELSRGPAPLPEMRAAPKGCYGGATKLQESEGSIEMRLKSTMAGAVSLALLMFLATAGPAAAAQVSEEEARAIGVEAYLYFYPLVTMDLTRRQLTNVEPGKGGLGGPPNTFVNIPEYPSAEMKVVVRPNFDTLYSSAWLDLTDEPMVVSVPDTDGRYYLLPMLDMWTNVFASPGWRTTGTQAGDFAILPPGWRAEGAELPAGAQRIDAPTVHVWIIGRTKTDGPKDYDAVHKLQAGFKITPLSRWGKPPEPVAVKIDPSVDMQTPPKLQVDRMTAGEYFAYAAEIMKLQPPHITDQPIIARMARIGIAPGESFDIDKVDPVVKQGLEGAPADAQKLMAWKIPTLARVANGWSMNTDTMGVYGNYYLKRAIVAQLGLGANLPDDAIYPLNIGDETGRPLDGASDYTIHFDQEVLPPVDAFWSITLYDVKGFQVANRLNRFAVSSWMPFAYNPDGSLDLYFQNQSPGADKEANWLPAPAGPFNLTMRLYAPRSDALTGKWNPPPVMKVQAPSFLQAQ